VVRVPLSLHRTVMGLLGRRDRRARATVSDDRVTIFLFNAHGRGGATRAVFNLAEELARTRPVDLVSVMRYVETNAFPFPEGVRMSVLDDRWQRRQLFARVLARAPSLLIHPRDRAYWWFSPRTDLLLLKRMRAVRSGHLVTTRPGLNLLAARIARKDVVVVAQEHSALDAEHAELRRDIADAYRGCDGVVLLTERDRQQYATALHGADSTRIVAIPNAVTPLAGDPLPPAHRRKVVVAAGRLARQKGFDLLVQAFAPVARAYPDWRLEIYGDGEERAVLAAQISAAGLSDVVSLPGPTRHLGEVLASSAVYALSSRWEGMPLVVLEAMSKAAAVIAFDCPTGPRELLSDGESGVLVPPEDVAALERALLRLIQDEALRARLGAGAVQAAAQYDSELIGQRWHRLLDGLAQDAEQPQPAAR
jgi:glycosyltransferase involved in cell wall biosynthesis